MQNWAFSEFHSRRLWPIFVVFESVNKGMDTNKQNCSEISPQNRKVWCQFHQRIADSFFL